MLQRIREVLALVLLAFLPFHAFLVTVGTMLLEGPGHAPLGMLALWKEALLGVIVLIALIEILRGLQPERLRWGTDGIDWLIIGLVLLSMFVSAMTHGDWKLFALGFKYDFLVPVAFLVLRRVAWSASFLPRAAMTVGISAVVLAIYGFWTLVAPDGFFAAIGYSDLHSLYVPGGPIAAFQQIGGGSIRRLQSAMSGPNHLGLWMLIPWSISLAALSRTSLSALRTSLFSIVLFVLTGLSILLSFSRSAWIGAFVILLMAAGMAMPKRVRSWMMISVAGIATLFAIVFALLFPSVLLRFASSRDHIARPIEAMARMVRMPLGGGLGIAGPASNRVSDACVFLDVGADASWAKDRPNLCVFVGDVQVQPVGNVCNCPFLPENWYLQIGVELGVAGFVLFLALTSLMLVRLRKQKHVFLFLAFLGIAVGALFLHAWEDAAVAMTLWLLAAAVLPLTYPPHPGEYRP